MAKRNYELVLVLSDKNADDKTRAKEEAEASLQKRGAEIAQKNGQVAVVFIQ